MFLSMASFAVDPDIRLNDPALEKRARKITQQLRCPTCVSQSVDSSNVGISRDLQVLVRDRLVVGDSDKEILDYIAARYGDYVLLSPRMNAPNAALWLLPFMIFGGVVAMLVLQARRRRIMTSNKAEIVQSKDVTLTKEETEKIAEILTPPD